MARHVGDVADADYGADVRNRKLGEIWSTHSAPFNSDRRVRVTVDFSWIYQRMLGRRISEGGIEQRNAGGNFYGDRYWNFGFGRPLDDGYADGAIKTV